MDESAERDSGLTWEAYLPGLFDQPATAAPPSPPTVQAAPEAAAEPAKQQRGRPGAPPPPQTRMPQPTADTADSFPAPAPRSRFVARSTERRPLSPMGALVMGVAIFLAIMIFIAVLP